MSPPVYFIVLLASVSATGTARPNIVLVIADDLGWSDLGFHGGDVETPNLDTLAFNSLNLRRHYSQAICTPSRSALLTGDYPIRHGMQGDPSIAGSADGLPVDLKLMPEYFQELGYRTHLVGKWHLGYETLQHLPTRRGFDTFFGYLNGYLGYWDGTHYYDGRAGRDIWRGETGAWREVYGRYLTEVLTEEAVGLIEKHPQNESMLLILSECAVHTTMLNMETEAPPTVTNHTHRGILREMARWMDWSVGEVISALDRKKILSNTILVFLSDNGAPTVDTIFANYGSNWPFRGQKVSGHEGGVRTAALVYSEHLHTGPRVTDQLFHITDWLPTLFSAAGGEVKNLKCKDGIDQWRSLDSRTKGPRYELLVNIDEVENTEAYIIDQWKLIKNKNGPNGKDPADRYTGMRPEWTAQDPEKLLSSKAGRVLGLPENWDKLRSALDLNVGDCRAPPTQDCTTNHCLFHLEQDPRECRDIASSNNHLVNQLESRLETYRAYLKKQPPKDYHEEADPKFREDYWGPWMVNQQGNSASSASSMNHIKYDVKQVLSCVQNIL